MWSNELLIVDECGLIIHVKTKIHRKSRQSIRNEVWSMKREAEKNFTLHTLPLHSILYIKGGDFRKDRIDYKTHFIDKAKGKEKKRNENKTEWKKVIQHKLKENKRK